MKTTKETYCAIAKPNGKYVVATIGPCGDFHTLGDVREFADFEGADYCARLLANGHFPNLGPSGQYISMR